MRAATDFTCFTDFNDINDFNNLPVFDPQVDNFVPPRCDYIQTENLCSFISGLSLSILLLNIRSQKRNFNVFLSEFSNYLNLFSIIAFTETWLTVDRDVAFSIPGFYSLNLYRNQYGGGLRLYIKDCFRTKILEEFTFLNDFYEILTVELDLGSCKYVLILLYHPPSSSSQNNTEFVNLFTFTLRSVLDLRLPVIIMGDLNLNLLSPDNHNYVNIFINNMLELNIYPAITRPTRISQINQRLHYSLLDQIWTTGGVSLVRSFILPTSITDHYPVGLVIENGGRFTSAPREIEMRSFSERNKGNFRSLLSSINILVNSGNFNSVFSNYYRELFLAYNIAFPLVKNRLGKKSTAPWMTEKLKKCIQEKRRLYKLYLRGKIQKMVYTEFKNKLTNIVRRVKSLYYAKLFMENGNNSKKVWDILNGLLNKRSKNTLKELVVNNVRLKGIPLVNYINNYFLNVAITIRGQTTNSVTYRCLAPGVFSSCFFPPADIHEIRSIIKQLSNKGSKLLDLYTLIIKENSDIFGTHLVILYNLSLEVSTFPELLKVARVTPTYKSGDIENVDNYRPISSLPVLSKLFERLTLNRMLSFIYDKDILSPHQFGFRKGCDVTQAVAKLTSLVIQAYHSRLFCACFFLDLRKAFDTVSHELLLFKLGHYGFRGQCLEYLKSYFENRKQFVFADGYCSDSGSVVCGVPQGSILGPICFSLFINDLPYSVKVDVVLFADDAAFIITGCTFDGLIAKIRELFEDLSVYLRNNQLVPNASKSKLMIFKTRALPEIPDINFFGRNIDWVSDFKYLGVTLTNNMSFAAHINGLTNKVSQVTGAFVGLKDIVPRHILIKLYYALVYPHISANIIIWGTAPDSHIRPLRVRINNLLRLILGVTWEENRPSISTSHCFKILSLLNIPSIFKLNLFKFLKLVLDGNLPVFYNLLMAKYVAPHGYGTRRIGYRCPDISCEVERRGLSYQLIALLEKLPAGLIDMNFNRAVKQFKRVLLNNQ